MKTSQALQIKNCTINVDDMTITEVTKDDAFVYSIPKILGKWNEVSGVTITIKKDNDLFDAEV